MIGFAGGVAAVAAAGMLVGCGSAASSTAPTSEAGTMIDVVIEDGSITPTGDRVDVKVGEPVTLRIDSDATDEIHVHSDPEHEFAVAPGPGPEQSFTFTVDVPGRVAVESHETDRTIVQLLVR